MRRKVLWIGIGVIIAGYLGWTALHLSDVSTPSVLTVPTNTAIASPSVTASAASQTPNATAATPTPTPAVAPTLLLNAGRVTRRSVIVASGLGFTPGEKLKLTRRGPTGPTTRLATAKADKSGNFSGIVVRVADTWQNGQQTVGVEGLSSHRRASAHFDLTGSPPGAQPTTYAGKPLSVVSFNGGGFGPHEEVDVYFDTLASPVLAHFRANDVGVVHVSGVAVPMSPPGQHAFLLMGKNSRAPVRIPFSVLAFTPWLALSNYTPQPEQAVGVVGHDFARGERVAIFLDAARGRPLSETTADKNGTFRIDPALVIPYNRRGKIHVVAVGTVSQMTVAATITVQPYAPTFALTRYAGPPGTAFGVTGQGFAKNEQVQVQVGGDQHPLVFSFQTDGKGRLAGAKPILIPKDTTDGKLKITAVGIHSQAPATVTFAVTPLSPWFGPVPAAGPAGARIRFNGGGFAPDETVQVTITSDAGTSAATSFTTDGQGGIKRAGSLLIPTTLTGKVSLEATGKQSGARASATYTVVGGPP